MDDDRHAVQADDLFGAGSAQVAQSAQLMHFAVVDRPRGGRQVGIATAEGDKAGAGPVSGNIDAYRLAMIVLRGDDGLVGDVARLLVDGGGLLRTQLPLNQCRQQGGADGVGALDAQVSGLGQGR